jgi:hypothetical protein
MATYREIINRVLISLGQGDDQVDAGATELTDANHIKVAEWVNDILEEVEAAAQWRVLRQRDTATITANGISGTLTTSNERSKLFYVVEQAHGQLIPLVFDVTDSSNQQRLIECDLSQLLLMDQQNSNAVSGSSGPTYFALNPTATGMEVYVWPRSSSERSIELDMIIPQARFDYTDDTDLDTSIKVPNMVVVYGSAWWSREDRGEEFGANGQKSEQRYRHMLADAVAAENAAQGFDELLLT